MKKIFFIIILFLISSNNFLFAAVDDYYEEELDKEMLKSNPSWKYVDVKQTQLIEHLSKKNTTLEQDNRGLKTDYDLMSVELRKIKLENKLAIFKLKVAALDNIKLQKNLNWIKSELQKQSNSADALVKDLYECKRSSAQFQAQAEFLEKTKEETPESFKKNKANWENALLKVNAEKLSLQDQLYNSRDQKSKLTQRVNFILKDNLKLRREIKDLKAKFINYTNIKKDLSLSKEKEDELNALVEAMKARHSKEIARFEEANQEQQFEIAKVIKEKNKTKDAYILVYSEKEDLLLKLKKITKENEQLQRDLTQIQSQMETSKNTKEKIEILTSDKNKLLEKIDIKAQEISQLQAQIKQTNESLAKAKIELASSNNKKEQLMQENENAKEKIEILTSDKNKLLGKKDNTAKENSQLQAQVEQVNESLAKVKGELVNSNSEKIQLMDKFKLLTKENSKLKDEVEQSKVELKNTALTNTNNINLKSNEVKSYQDQIGKLQVQLENAIAENKMLKSKLEKSGNIIVKQKEKDKKVIVNSDAEVVKLKKESADMHYNLGVILQKDNKIDEAIQEYSKALELNSQDAAAHYNLGLIFSAYKNNRDKAIEHYQKYLELSPNDTDAQIVKVKLTQLENEKQVWGDSQTKSIGDKEKLGRW